MVYQRIKPWPKLSRFVESIWIQESDEDASLQAFPPTHILPTGKLDLLFHYRDPFVQHHDNVARLLPHSMVFGQTTRPSFVSATGRTGILIVCLQPWGALPLLGVPASEFTDSYLDLRGVLKASLSDCLENRLKSAENNRRRLQILQEFLSNVLRENYYDALVCEAAFRINRSNGTLSIRGLAEDMQVSRRHLARRFKQSIGISPKLFASIVRFQKAIGLKRAGQTWNKIATHCDYYDQAHFVTEFKTFSGMPPNSLPKNSLTANPIQRFNRRDLSHFYNTIYL